ncbi:MAG: hypothetical protein CO035_05265 [Candidatus Omnitrophica bacterium CG_4_9_14_0_2_um_filter_42_8]|nr:MAG: hypothetical protein CO035_05265 [Candidatus Omnitrophica bacterium CG_4_9_14_0_2_um_filter_42_8]
MGNSEGVIHHSPQWDPNCSLYLRETPLSYLLRGMRGKNLILLVAPVCAGGFFKKRVSLGIKDLDSYPQPVQAI